MSDPTTIIALFQQTLTGTTQSIKKAESALEQLQKDQIFLTNLILIIRQPNINRNLRKAAALYTKKYVKSKLMEKDQDKINTTAEVLLNQLSQTGTELLLRRYIASSLEYLLMNDMKFTLRQKLNPLCIRLLEEAKTADDANVNYQFLGFFAQVLMTSFIHLTKEQNTFMQSTISVFSQLSLRVFKYVNEIISSKDRQKILHIFKILKLYSYTLKIYFRRMMLAELQTVKLLYDEHITLLISASLNLSLKNNQLNTTLVYFNQQADHQIVELFHSVKADYVQAVGYLMRSVFLHFKDKQMIAANAILSSPTLIPSFINALSQLLTKTPYYKIKSPSLIKLIEQLIHCQIYAVRNPFYFQYFLQYKEAVVHGCILKVLQFSRADCDKFYEEPDQFINELLQIVEMDSGEYIKNRDKDVLFSESNEEIQEYSNLRTLAAMLLEALCKHIDGSLPQILSYSLSVLKNQVQSQFPKSILLLMLSILRSQILDRQTELSQILPVLSQSLKSRPLPKKIRDSENTPLESYSQNIEYLIILLTVFRFLNVVPEVSEDEIKVFYQVVYAILVSQDVSTGLQYEAFDLVSGLCQRQGELEVKFVQLCNNLLAANTPNKQKCLQTLTPIFSSPSPTLLKHPQLVSLTVKHMSSIVYTELQKQANFQQLIVNKCWNVIGSVYQSSDFIPRLIPDIENAVLPLLPFIDGKTNYDFEEDIFMMMSSFIEKSQTVTQNQLVMFEIIPKLFYSQYEYRFGHAFETLHIFILYGKDILAANPQAIKVIIEMAVCNMNTTVFDDCPRNQGENCEGVMIIQSLILSCGNCFTGQIWIQLAKALTKRLQNPPVKGHILNSNILASLALILTMGHKSFTPEDCDILLNRILHNYGCFVVRYSIKVVTVAFSELLALWALPFVSGKFTLLLDTTVMLLQSCEKKDLFNKNPITQEERDYDICLQTTKNAIVEMDEVDHFKKKFNLIKEQNSALLKKAVGELKDTRQKYLQKIVNTVLVNNESRPVFKIKK